MFALHLTVIVATTLTALHLKNRYIHGAETQDSNVMDGLSDSSETGSSETGSSETGSSETGSSESGSSESGSVYSGPMTIFPIFSKTRRMPR
jgi:hypothetical protein